jgi:pimeloyl-ACP methyl ester carboxylesterase
MRSMGILGWFLLTAITLGAQPKPWWPDGIETRLVAAGANRGELELALKSASDAERPSIGFLITHMPESDLKTLKGDFLITNVRLAHKARQETPWGKAVPEAIFLNDVLPYANIDEKRDAWRQEFYDLAMPMVKDCKTATDAVKKLNAELFPKIQLKYSTQRKAPNQSPKESIEQGKASCTGLSIVLADACRAVGIPARLVGTPLWANKSGNHTWVEIWDDGWHFTGACEPDPAGLDRGWFIGNAAEAIADVPEHAIYAASFQKTKTPFPLVWAPESKVVSAENVTARYAKTALKPTTAKVIFKALGVDKKRLAIAVEVLQGNTVETWGMTRDETADTNDVLTFELKPKTTYTFETNLFTKQTITTGDVGSSQTVTLNMPTQVTAIAESGAAKKAMLKFLETTPADWPKLAESDAAKVALSLADSEAVRAGLTKAFLTTLKKERAQEIADRKIVDGKLEMKFDFKIFGEKPKAGRSLWISLHGGGGAPANVNEQQWENQKKLYKLDEGIYLVPRAPTNTWNLWHEAHIDRMFARLIESMIAVEDVDPNRVYLLGYSAGGDGVYQLAPRMADRFAAAAMMAGHPNGVSMLSLRNLPFALQVGAKDSAYDRNKVGQEYGEKLKALHQADPKGYTHFVKIHEGKPHWMGGEDKVALPWMAKFTRNPIPEKIVWKQTGTIHERSYWLETEPKKAVPDALIIAERKGQVIHINKSEKANSVRVYFDDRMLNLDQPVTVLVDAEKSYRRSQFYARRGVTLVETLLASRDPNLMFDAVEFTSLEAAK